MRKLWKLAVVLGLVAWVALPARALDEKKMADDVQIAIATFKSVDPGLTNLLATAAGYVVFPGIGKGGLVFGGAHGDGLVFEKGKVIGQATLSQFTVGGQIGGQKFAEIIFFETPAALERFKQSKFEMSAQVSAVAISEGVSRNAKYVDGVMVITRATRGLMAEASVGGQKLKFKPSSKSSQ